MLISQNLRRAASVQPDRMAMSDGTTRRTWRELADRVPRLAGGLRGLGLEPGERVAILANNIPAFFELYYAAPWAGLIMASLNTRWSITEMAEALDDSGAAALVVDPAFAHLAGELRAMAPSVRFVIAAGGTFGDATWEMLAGRDPVPDAAPDPDETAYLFYTGGTTGRAKGVMLSAANFYVAGLSSLHTAGVGAASTYAINVPLFHMSGGGLMAGQMAAAAGARLVPKFEAESSMAAVAEAGATHVIWVPTMLSMVLNSPAFGRHDLDSLERILYGSAPMPPAILDRAMQAMPNVRFTQYYGMTELTGNATFLGPDIHAGDHADPRLRSVGVPIPGAEVEIVGPDGTRLAAGEVGEIRVRGPIVTQGYWGQPEKTAEAIRDGWMHTGDLGRQDETGHVFLVDRLKDMIITGGENVYSNEVENALYAHPAVKECAVIGLPDETWGEVVTAVVHPAEGEAVTAEALVTHCRGRIGGFKLPRRIIFTTEPLPKSAAGKILKTDLRATYIGTSPAAD